MGRRLVLFVLALSLIAFAVPALAGSGGQSDDGNIQNTENQNDDRDQAQSGDDDERFVDLQILAVNDFHGNLESPGNLTIGGVATPVGGVDFLAALVRQQRATNPDNTVFVSAGDMIGASPLISALFHDEPAIEAFNLMDLDFNAVGNHEFDEGYAELLRMQNGGCHPVDGCVDGDPFLGADFQYLAANVIDKNTGNTIFPGVGIATVDEGVRVGFIGMTLEGTPTIVTPSGVAGLEFLDEADTVNKLVDELDQSVDIIVVLIHEGGFPAAGSPLNGCNGISGAIVDIVNRTSDKVDLFISGHTHAAYICTIDGRPVTSTNAFGRLLTDIDLRYDRVAETITGVTIDNLVVRRTGVTPAADVSALVAKYKALSAPLANRLIGSITADIRRAGLGVTTAGESELGDVIADAQLAATAPNGFGNAVIAMMNPGGIRQDFIFGNSQGGELPGQITYAEAFSVQPFGNSLVTMTLTGAQIKTVLEQQFNNPGAGQNRILQVSKGFSYTWSAGAAQGSKVTNMMLNGVPINPVTSYRVTVNSFLADGGDLFLGLLAGTNRLGGAVDLDALVAYFGVNSPVAPGPQNRITRIP